MEAKLFAAYPGLVSEGPRFNAAEQTLYWVDVTGGKVLRKKVGTDVKAFDVHEPGLGKIGALAFAPDGRLLLFADRCEIHACAFGQPGVLKWTLPGHAATRFNDVYDAGDGVYFCGVAPIRPDIRGELWRFDAKTGTFTCIEAATAGMPNGMGVSPDGKTFYFVVSDERRIYAYDFDPIARTVAAKRVLCEDFAGAGVPDGMCVNPSDGTLFVARWDGHRLERRSAEGRLLETVEFPIAKITSADVAGNRLFVTTANLPFDETAFAEHAAGGVFELSL
ncbi:MAG: SMP-30/gluconolactonase/LRE family protein [Kiritimatiellia bacterium]